MDLITRNWPNAGAVKELEESLQFKFDNVSEKSPLIELIVEWERSQCFETNEEHLANCREYFFAVVNSSNFGLNELIESMEELSNNLREVRYFNER